MAIPVYFAPLQGFTDAAYRTAHAELIGGVERYSAPFLRLEHGEVRRRDIRDLEFKKSQMLIPQVIANGVEEFERLTALLLTMGFKDVDLNLGCPFPMQTRHGRGAALMQQPDRLEEIFNAMRRLHDEQGVRFSVKMRLGQNAPDEWQPLMTLLNAAPLEYVAMHPRIGTQQYKGEVDMEMFRRFYDACELPIVYSGDLTTVEQMSQMVSDFPKLKALMVGRGLLMRPTLAREYAEGKAKGDDEVRALVMQLHGRVLSHYEQTLEGGEAQILQKILPFWEYPQELFDRKFIKRLKKARTLTDYRVALTQR